MDPVEKTFDTVYYYSLKASRLVSNAAKAVSDTTCNAVESIANVVSSPPDKSNSSKLIAPSRHEFSLDISAGLQRLRNEKKLAIAALISVSALGLAGYFTTQKILALKKKKRRAIRLANGARKDVVLIVGSVSEPLTRYIAHDLENRGFIVYITSTNSKADVKFFNNESIQDIKSLIISDDFYQNDFNSQQLHKFDFLLSSEHIPFQGAEPNKLNLVGMVFVPDMYFPSGKFHLIPGSTWSNSFSKRSLLPLNLLSNGLIGLAEKYDSNIIFLTPTISSSLTIPYHSVENLTSILLQEICKNLAVEYEALNITNVKLGSIRINSNNNRKSFGIRGEPLKNLHYRLFDLLYSNHNSSIEYVGFGARFLSYFGCIIPRWLVRNYFDNYFGE